MVHVLTMMEGQPRYIDNYINWLLHRRYYTQLPNDPGMAIQPNVREVRIFDISVPESCTGQLLYDLSPYNHGHGDMKSKVFFASKIMRKILGLKEVGRSGKIHHNEYWRRYLNVFVIGKKPDVWMEKGEYRCWNDMTEMI